MQPFSSTILPGGRQIKTGVMYKIKFPLHEFCQEGIIVGTSRPETLFGDVAVAIRSDYAMGSLFQVPRSIFHPILHREVSLIVDDEMVAPCVGTGAMKASFPMLMIDYTRT